MSRTEQRIPKYGVSNEFLKQQLNVTNALLLGVEHTAIYGVPHIVTATNRRQTGGLSYFITTNVDSTSPWLDLSSIETQQANAWDLGGGFDMIVARPGAFQALNNLAGSERVQVDFNDERRGRSRATVVTTEYGEVTLARDRWIRSNEAFAYNRENFIERVFQPLVMFPLAKTDDTDKVAMVTELGFEVKGQDHMAKWTALDPDAELPGSGLT